MQRQLRAPARRRQKPNLRVPVRSVSAKVKCCTAVLGGSLSTSKGKQNLGTICIDSWSWKSGGNCRRMGGSSCREAG